MERTNRARIRSDTREPTQGDSGRAAEKTPNGDLLTIQRHIGNRATRTLTDAQEGVLRRPAADTSTIVSRIADRTTDGPALPSARAPWITPVLQRSGGGDVIQRHASWEHKMLGDVDPETLEIISAGQDVKAEEKRKQSWFASTRNSAKTIKSQAGKAIDLETVQHTIDQEIRRLQHFAKAPPEGKVSDATAALQKLDADDRKAELGPLKDQERIAKEKEIDDAKWDVRLVSLKLKDGKSFLVTYGEMNTLADFYGSAAEIAQTPADNFRGIVKGVREESIRKFMRLRNDLTLGKDKYDPDSKEHSIKGAIGNKGTLLGSGAMGAALNRDQYGELKLMGEVGDEKRAEIDGKAETSYTAGLARNACHFAPHSWHAWSAAHDKAVALAQQSWALSEQARQAVDLDKQQKQHPLEDDGYDEVQVAKWRDEAEDKLNSALIENGFGDHFLQDSYAAGHLIDKTLIMQWFAKWLDGQTTKRDYTSADDWRQIQQVAYGQPGIAGRGLSDPSTIGNSVSNDPQSVENMAGDWKTRFAALGLQVPSVLTNHDTDEFKVFVWWQEQAADGKMLTADYKDLLKDGPVKNKKLLQAALFKLIDAGVVYYKNYSVKDRAEGAESIGIEGFFGAKPLKLKREYIPKDKNKFMSAATKAKTGDMSEYGDLAKAVTYDDYHKFLNHGYLQLASNVLHDHFCLNGLLVATGQNETPYKIYGDNAMLGKESSRMVKFSAETSHQSRDAIYEIARAGQTAKTSQTISARFPTWVKPPGAGKTMSLATWHGEGGSLNKFCTDTLFPQAAALFSKSTAVASNKLTEKVSKDVHAGDLF